MMRRAWLVAVAATWMMASIQCSNKLEGSSLKAVLSLTFDSVSAEVFIDEQALVIEVYVPWGTDVTALTPRVMVSTKATINWPQGAMNFSSPVMLSVTAENGSSVDYQVNVIIRNASALLVVDVQKGWLPVQNTEVMLTHILELIGKARAAGAPVVYLMAHSEEEGVPLNSEAWQLADTLAPLDSELILSKDYANSFRENDLHARLLAQRVGRVVVCGLATQHCVKATCLGALDLHYWVVLAADAHSNHEPTADLIIQWTHEELGALEGCIVQPTSEIQF
jgi:nicotinamidase-related amidase